MNQDILHDKKINERLTVLKVKAKKIIKEISRNHINNENITKLSILSAFIKKPFYIYSGSKKLDKYIFDSINNIFSDSKPFEILVDSTTTIDDILGPVDEDAIKEGKYIRKIIGFLASSDVCLISNGLNGDRFIKNVLLDFFLQSTYMNNGTLVHLDVPLKIMTGDFNRPTDEISKHIWNSIFIKYFINTTSDARDAQKGINAEENMNYHINLKDEEKFKLEDIEFVNALTSYVVLDEPSKIFISKLKEKVSDFNDNRKQSKQHGIDQILNSNDIWKSIDKILKISAILNGRLEVDITDCFIVEHILWNQPIHSNVVAKFINDLTSNFEYGFYSQYDLTKEKYIGFSSYIKSEIVRDLDFKKIVEEKVFINDNSKYYLFSSEKDMSSFFIDIKDINMLKNTSSVVGTIDLSIKIYSKEQFVTNKEATERVFINFDGKNYYIFNKNNINNEKIKINPDLIEVKSNSIEKIEIDQELMPDIKNWMKSLIFDLHYDIRELNKLLEQDFSQLTKVNVFICDRKMDFYKKSIKDTLNKLNRIRESVQMISTNIKLASKGMYNGTIDNFVPSLGF
ncbi:MAG: hypothetical protein ACRC8C_01385 [Mycoplasmoidaceae bacterium]